MNLVNFSLTKTLLHWNDDCTPEDLKSPPPLRNVIRFERSPQWTWTRLIRCATETSRETTSTSPRRIQKPVRQINNMSRWGPRVCRTGYDLLSVQQVCRGPSISELGLNNRPRHRILTAYLLTGGSMQVNDRVITENELTRGEIT